MYMQVTTLLSYRVSLNSIGMILLLNAEECEFECTKTHYPFIYGCEGAIDNFKHYVKKKKKKQVWFKTIIKLLKKQFP